MKKKKHTVEKEPVFSVDTEDPIKARLPALIMEMRRAHEEVVPPKGWTLYGILLMIPVIGAAVFLYMGYFKKEITNRNTWGFSRCAFFLNLLWTVILTAACLVFLYYGRDIYHAVCGMIGG